MKRLLRLVDVTVVTTLALRSKKGIANSVIGFDKKQALPIPIKVPKSDRLVRIVTAKGRIKLEIFSPSGTRSKQTK